MLTEREKGYLFMLGCFAAVAIVVIVWRMTIDPLDQAAAWAVQADALASFSATLSAVVISFCAGFIGLAVAPFVVYVWWTNKK